ncbi:hypothetical protein HC256_005563 [Beauveria bassiana]|nr:hypothetical protein HC256_005563 [Beauveria bassiana]
MDDASHEPFDETLLSVQAIVQSLEDAGKIGSTVYGCDQTSQHKGEHEAARRSASSPSFEHEKTNDRPRLSVEVAVECPTGVSASTSRLRTSTTTSLFARSRTSSPSCESSLSDAASPQTRCTSMSANGEGAKTTSTSEMPRRVDSQLHSLSSISQPQPMPSPPDHDRTGVDITPEASPGPSQRLPSSTDDVIHVSDDTTSDRADALSHERCATSPPLVQTVVQSLEDTGNISTTTHDCDQTSKYQDKREVTPRPLLPTPGETQANQSAGLSSAELAGCSTVVSPSTSQNTASMPTPMPAISRAMSPSLGSQSRDIVSTQISPTSMSAAHEGTVETENEKCTETTTSENSVYEPKAFECTDGNAMTVKPLTSRMCSQLQNKRLREPSADHDTEKHEVEGSARASDDPEYCPPTCDELETDSDGHFSDKNQSPRKRHKSRSVSAKTKSRIQEINQRESAGLDQGLQLISPTSDDAHNMEKPIDAVFDEWTLQDVILRRTIMDGKATFQFQFDWDLCMKHGAETGRKGSMKQGQGKPIVKSNKRSCRKPRDETKGRQCRRCGRPGHNARTCQNSIELSNDGEE